MVLTRSETARRYREKKARTLGDENWKATQAAMKRAERARKRGLSITQASAAPESKTATREDLQALINILQSELDAPRRPLEEVAALIEQKGSIANIRNVEDCNDLVVRAHKYKQALYDREGRGKTVTLASTKQHLGRIQRLHKLMTGSTVKCTDLSWLKDTAAVIAFVDSNKKWTKLSTRRSYFESAAAMVIGLKGYKPTYEIYSKLSSDVYKKEVEQKDEGLMSEAEQKRAIPWKTLKHAYTKAPKGSRAQALMAMYSLIPPRRNDIGLLTLGNDETKQDKERNYLLLDSNGKPDKLVFNSFKTFKEFGQQIFNVPDKLKTVLSAYIKKAKLKNGDMLFGTKKNEPYANFSLEVAKIYKKHTDKPLTVNMIRHSFVTTMLNTPNVALKTKKTIALKMAHSLQMQASYARIDLEDAETIED